MARAVDGDLLVDYIRKIDMPFETKITVICTVNTMPTIDPVKQGHWNLVSRQNIWDDLVDVYECSECKKYTTNGRGNTSPTDYCPNCGARMDGEKSSRD